MGEVVEVEVLAGVYACQALSGAPCRAQAGHRLDADECGGLEVEAVAVGEGAPQSAAGQGCDAELHAVAPGHGVEPGGVGIAGSGGVGRCEEGENPVAFGVFRAVSRGRGFCGAGCGGPGCFRSLGSLGVLRAFRAFGACRGAAAHAEKDGGGEHTHYYIKHYVGLAPVHRASQPSAAAVEALVSMKRRRRAHPSWSRSSTSSNPSEPS